ncbi:MAG TPA: hypothetical protein VF457_11550 [Burkholderiaceae bacterium]
MQVRRKLLNPSTSLQLIRQDDPLWARLYAFTLRTLFPVGAVSVLMLILRQWFKGQ